MKHEKLSDALGHISDRHIAEAAKPKRRFPWVAAVVAVLALAILLSTMLPRSTPGVAFLQGPTEPLPSSPAVSMPPLVQVELLSQKYSVAQAKYPVLSPYGSGDAYTQWSTDQREMHNQPLHYADNLRTAWQTMLPILLSETPGQNTACSPLNIYMALAMLAECTDGESRQQILDLFNADSMEALRTQAKHVWRGHYNNDGLSKSVLGSSLWLDEGINYDQDTVKLLAENYYASVFQGDLGTDEMNEALQSWLNEQTDGLLQEQAQNVKLSPESVLGLATTISYQVQWNDEFNKNYNTQAVFHGTGGDTRTTYMNQVDMSGYFWSENFGATLIGLRDGSRMWLFLPDEGVTPEEIVGEVAQFLAQDPSNWGNDLENRKHVIRYLTMPKFDVTGDSDITPALKSMGITDVFRSESADFSPIVSEDADCFVGKISHAARVLVDEKGVTAAAYTVIDTYGAAQPPNEEVYFTLDRPFMFVVESQDDLPLFAGIVNQA